MYFILFNLNYFIMCTVLYFKKGNITNIPNIIIFSLCAILFLFMYIKFVIDPDSFGYLRYSFRYTAKSMLY